MALSARRQPTESAAKVGAMRPVLLAAGLGLFWFVEYQEGGDVEGAPMWAYLAVNGVRVVVDFVGAWFVVSALQLAIGLVRFGLTYLRGLWLQESR
jgi:hypothetical protein